MNVGILVPTLNAGISWERFLIGLDNQSLLVKKKVILDSGSSDNTVNLAENHGFDVHFIDKKDFDHGYARQLLFEAASDCDILIYLTQDAILKGKDSLLNLVNAFSDPTVGLAYGRQVPHEGAKVLESHARLFNYPATSIVKGLKDKSKLGIKTASCSNSFAGYRRSAFVEVGGFPKQTIFAEDVIVGGKMLIKGWNIAYVSNSEVYHSHDYSVVEEFRRYFDIGVYHATNMWLIDEFGKADGEGLKYLKSELQYVIKNNILVLPKMIASIGAKFLGYKLGMMHDKLSMKQKRNLSMHKRYWDKALIK